MTLDAGRYLPQWDDGSQWVDLMCTDCAKSVHQWGPEHPGDITLEDYLAAALAHETARHAPPKQEQAVHYLGQGGTAWFEGADGPVAWAEELTYRNRGTVEHRPMVSFRICRHEWTSEDDHGGRYLHRCVMPPDRPHDWHRCGCGELTSARLAPDSQQLEDDQRLYERTGIQRKRSDPYQRSVDAP